MSDDTGVPRFPLGFDLPAAVRQASSSVVGDGDRQAQGRAIVERSAALLGSASRAASDVQETIHRRLVDSLAGAVSTGYDCQRALAERLNRAVALVDTERDTLCQRIAVQVAGRTDAAREVATAAAARIGAPLDATPPGADGGAAANQQPPIPLFPPPIEPPAPPDRIPARPVEARPPWWPRVAQAPVQVCRVRCELARGYQPQSAELHGLLVHHCAVINSQSAEGVDAGLRLRNVIDTYIRDVVVPQIADESRRSPFSRVPSARSYFENSTVISYHCEEAAAPPAADQPAEQPPAPPPPRPPAAGPLAPAPPAPLIQHAVDPHPAAAPQAAPAGPAGGAGAAAPVHLTADDLRGWARGWTGSTCSPELSARGFVLCFARPPGDQAATPPPASDHPAAEIVPRPPAPAPPQTGPCVRLVPCDATVPAPPEPPAVERWAVWLNRDRAECTVTRASSQPTGEGWERVGVHDDRAQADSAARAACESRPDERPSGAPATIRWPISPEWCKLEPSQFIHGRLIETATPTVPLPSEMIGARQSWIERFGIGILDALVHAAIELARDSGCFSGGYLSIFAARVVNGFLAQWVAPVFADLDRALSYYSNSHCPTIIPSAEQATEAWLAGGISNDQLTAWLLANGVCPEPWSVMLDARRSRFDPLTLVALRRRGFIDATQYTRGMREQGWIHSEQHDLLWRLSDQVPPLTDLLRFMVRDVENPAVVEPFGLDVGFTDNWRGQLKEWGYQQGITEQYARYSWRAHWDIPSPGQLYAMLHRLRHLPAGDPLKVTEHDVETALKQDDVLPFWVPKLMAISYSVPTRLDARRAFQLGTIDEARLEKNYQQLGYDDENARLLTTFEAELKRRRFRSHPAAKLYRQNLINRQAAIDWLKRDGADDQGYILALQEADDLAEADVRKVCVAAVKKRHATGELDHAGTIDALVAVGLDLAQAERQARALDCQRAARGKMASASQLCRWLELGAITGAEFARRLIRTGWDERDARRFLRDCEDRLSLKRDREAAKAARQQAQMVRAERAEAEKAQRDAERLRAAQRKGVEASVRARTKREQALLDAAQKFAARTNIEYSLSVSTLKGLRAYAQRAFAISLDEANRAAIEASEVFDPESGPSLRELAATAALAIASGEIGNGAPS